MTSVAIVDDHPIFCETLASMINKFDGYRVTILAFNGLDLIEKIETTGCPDIILLDLSMPKMNGTETAIWLRKNHPGAKIILLSEFCNEIVLVRLLKVGVRGFLAKDGHPVRLQEAMGDIMEKGFYFRPDESKQIIELLNSIETRNSSLDGVLINDREIEFLKHCCTELNMRDIAKEMNLGIRTVDDMRNGLYNKLKTSNRLGLAIYAFAHGIIHL